MPTILAIAVLLLLLLCSVRLATGRPTTQEPLVSGKKWAMHEQDNRTCNAGSRTFTGTVNVATGKTLSFWFVESRQAPEDRPVLVWLSGGPGASSLIGLFAEVGPCTLDRDDTQTSLNPDSWSNHANLLFVDQPAGVGFSTIDDESLLPGELDDASPDFSTLISTFFTLIFPQYASNGVIFAGESHGGRYVPRYVYDIARAKRTTLGQHLFPFDVLGIILVDALVGAKYQTTSQYDLFCTDSPSSGYLRFNESVCEAMAAATPECERLFELCEVTLDPYSCKAAGDFCDNEVGKYFTAEYMSGRRSPYDVRKSCPVLPLCSGTNPGGGSLNTYLNKPEIQKLLGFERPVNYSDINYALNEKWTRNPIITVPSTSEVVYLLDKENANVLVLNGQFDVADNVPGTVRFYDGLGWHGQAGYRARNLEEWHWKDSLGEGRKGGTRKGFRNLQFFSINGAGHQSPGDQKGAVRSVFERWLADIQKRTIR